MEITFLLSEVCQEHFKHVWTQQEADQSGDYNFLGQQKLAVDWCIWTAKTSFIHEIEVALGKRPVFLVIFPVPR